MMGILTITGWWLTYPSETYEFVNWDDDIPNRWKNNPNVPNHQPDLFAQHKDLISQDSQEKNLLNHKKPTA